MSGDDNRPRLWLALSCSPDGTIREVLRNDIGAASAEPGAPFAGLIAPPFQEGAENLLQALRERGAVVGFRLNVVCRDTTVSMQFAGTASAGTLHILAAPETSLLIDLLADLENSTGTLPALRSLLERQRPGMTAALARDTALYEELSRLNNELINRERELARKTAALERVAAERNRVVAIVAHDLRNPLTVIASYADLLKLEGAVEGEHATYVEEIARSARFMMELVEEMLDAAHLESGHVAVDFLPINVVAAAEHASAINRLRAARKQITIQFERQAEEALIMADPVKLRQIINNLAVNAIKFSPSNTRVTIRARREETEAVVEVEDQGVGIAPDKIASIFEPFKTLRPEGTGGEKSTGLGLSIVKQFVELHNGRIEVESGERQGSLFRVFFPLVR